MFLFFFPFEDLDRRYKIQGARLWRMSLSLYSWDNEEGGKKERNGIGLCRVQLSR